MEIVAAALDRHVCAWHDDGAPSPASRCSRSIREGRGGRPGIAQGDVHARFRVREGGELFATRHSST
jgi:hypothetical protein